MNACPWRLTPKFRPFNRTQPALLFCECKNGKYAVHAGQSLAGSPMIKKLFGCPKMPRQCLVDSLLRLQKGNRKGPDSCVIRLGKRFSCQNFWLGSSAFVVWYDYRTILWWGTADCGEHWVQMLEHWDLRFLRFLIVSGWYEPSHHPSHQLTASLLGISQTIWVKQFESNRNLIHQSHWRPDWGLLRPTIRQTVIPPLEPYYGPIMVFNLNHI